MGGLDEIGLEECPFPGAGDGGQGAVHRFDAAFGVGGFSIAMVGVDEVGLQECVMTAAGGEGADGVVDVMGGGCAAEFD